MAEHEYQTIRIWISTHQRLRKIAAETGESMVEVLERLAAKEQERLHPMTHPSKETIDAWAEGMLNEALSDMQQKGLEINPDTFSQSFQEQYGLPFDSIEAAQWLKGKEEAAGKDDPAAK